jgi:hypothetical protein
MEPQVLAVTLTLMPVGYAMEQTAHVWIVMVCRMDPMLLIVQEYVTEQLILTTAVCV